MSLERYFRNKVGEKLFRRVRTNVKQASELFERRYAFEILQVDQEGYVSIRVTSTDFDQNGARVYDSFKNFGIYDQRFNSVDIDGILHELVEDADETLFEKYPNSVFD
ncbi:MAG: hypothetical protein LBV67_11545 [Streptococcaceae bacterium]|jgi:hypothetical protein|nr:hypothetical protein [Streptococcaceae bacterium]